MHIDVLAFAARMRVMNACGLSPCRITCQVVHRQARQQPVLLPVLRVDRLMVRLPACLQYSVIEHFRRVY